MSAAEISLVKAATDCVVSSAWEGTVLVAVVALLLKPLRGMSAAARFVVWSALLIVLVALPFLSPEHSTAVANESAVTGHVVSVPMFVAWAFCAMWMVLSVSRFVQLVRSGLYVLRVSRESLPLNAAQRGLFALPETTLDKMYTSALVDAPCVGGFLRPRILLPEVLLELMPTEELAQIVEHELEHLRRRDPWLNLVQKICVALFPLNPALWWAERRLCAERELACDDRVLAGAAMPKEYALSLTNLAELSMTQRTVSLMLGAWRKRSELSVRVHRILSSQRPWREAATAGVAVMLSVGVAGAGILLGRTPSIIGYSEAVPSAQRAAVRVDVAENTVPVVVKNLSTVQGQVRAHPARMTKVRKVLTVPVGLQPVLAESQENATSEENAADVAWATNSKMAETLPHVRPVLLEDARHKYAAFRMADGWLLIQL